MLKTRSNPFGIKLKIGNHITDELTDDIFAVIVQYPADNGTIYDYKELFEKAKQKGIATIVAADLMSLALLTPPGEFGADVVVGSTQRFGVPMSYGGPHAAYFAAKEEFKRIMPGRIIGISIGRRRKQSVPHGSTDKRAAHQTRKSYEQYMHGAGFAGNYGWYVCSLSRSGRH